MIEPTFPSDTLDSKAMTAWSLACGKYRQWVNDHYDDGAIKGTLVCCTCGSLIDDGYIDAHTRRCISAAKEGT